MKRIYGLIYYDYAIGPDVSKVMYNNVEDAYKKIHELGYTIRVEPLVYRHESKPFMIAEIETYLLK